MAGFLSFRRLDALIVTFYSLNEGGDMGEGDSPESVSNQGSSSRSTLPFIFSSIAFPNRSTTTFNSILLFIWHGGRKFVFFNSRFESEYGT